MSLLVVGSVALDTIETPFGKVEDAVGGSAMYFSASASYFTDVRLVAVAPQGPGVDTPADLERVRGLVRSCTGRSPG